MPEQRRSRGAGRAGQSWERTTRPEAHVCFDRHLKIAAGNSLPPTTRGPLPDRPARPNCRGTMGVGRRCHFHRFGLFLAGFWKAAARAAKAGTETGESRERDSHPSSPSISVGAARWIPPTPAGFAIAPGAPSAACCERGGPVAIGPSASNIARVGLARRARWACRATSWPDRRGQWHHRPPDQMMARRDVQPGPRARRALVPLGRSAAQCAECSEMEPRHSTRCRYFEQPALGPRFMCFPALAVVASPRESRPSQSAASGTASRPPLSRRQAGHARPRSGCPGLVLLRICTPSSVLPLLP